jgi:uncharacterized sulfatase
MPGPSEKRSEQTWTPAAVAVSILLLVGGPVIRLGADDGAAVPASAERPWNIITIVTDDQGAWALGSYGNDEIRTPNLDRLAGQGMRFTNAFTASPVCTASRVTLLTGLYPSQVGTTDVFAWANWEDGLANGVPTWPRALRDEGYVTGLIGKWHLGSGAEYYPTRYGIDYFYGFLGGSHRPMDPVLVRDGEAGKVQGSLPDILVDDAMDFVETHADRPFALMLHFRAPHLPYGPIPEVDSAPFEGRELTVPGLTEYDRDYMGINEMGEGGIVVDGEATAAHRRYLQGAMRAYYASIHSVDRNLGRLFERLDELQLSERTIIIFTSDQGYLLGHRGMTNKGAATPLRAGTYQPYEFVQINLFDLSVQVPLIIRWPGVTRPGSVTDELVSHIDLSTTIRSMVGAAVGEPADVKTDARDLTPLLRGEDVTWRDTVFAEYTPDQIGNLEFIRMARTRDWKLVRTYLNPGGNKLFHVAEDPAELRNLYYPPIGVVPRVDAYQEQRELLQERLDGWQSLTGDFAPALDEAYRNAKDARTSRWKAEKQ